MGQTVFSGSGTPLGAVKYSNACEGEINILCPTPTLVFGGRRHVQWMLFRSSELLFIRRHPGILYQPSSSTTADPADLGLRKMPTEPCVFTRTRTCNGASHLRSLASDTAENILVGFEVEPGPLASQVQKLANDSLGARLRFRRMLNLLQCPGAPVLMTGAG